MKINNGTNKINGKRRMRKLGKNGNKKVNKFMKINEKIRLDTRQSRKSLCVSYLFFELFSPLLFEEMRISCKHGEKKLYFVSENRL